MKDFLLGSLSPQEFFAAFFFALVGVAISLLLNANKRDIISTNTPYKFSYLFLIADNWKRIVLGLLLIAVAIRFCPELFDMQLTMFWALVIGFSLDKVAQWLKDKAGVLQVNREGIK